MPDFYSDLVIEHGGKVMIASTAMIEVTAITEPDPDWTWTDQAGHKHVTVEDEGAVRYPTLEVVSSAASYCSGCQDVHPEIWFECRECHERTLPGVRPGQRRLIRGMTIYMIDEDEVTEEQASEFVAAWSRDQDNTDADPLAMLIKGRMGGFGHGSDEGGLPGMGG